MPQQKLVSTADDDGGGVLETPEVSRRVLLRRAGAGAAAGGVLLTGLTGLTAQEVEAAAQQPALSSTGFTVIIVYGVAKLLPVKLSETIHTVKLHAMARYGIPAADAANYVLRARINRVDQVLEESLTVAQAKLHKLQLIILACAAPFG